LFVSSTGHAQIYKWVDANGQTHYSERKADAGKATAVELKVESQSMSTRAANSSAQDWQEKERQFKQRQAQKRNEETYGPTVANKPQALSGGRSDETDSSRCNLARDVISGAVSHRNRAPIDKHDREVAENDIRAFCH
jgi:hypothetical protein